MVTIIAGSRTITSYQVVEAAIRYAPWPVTEIVSGNARGVDLLGERYARRNKIRLTIMPADWNQFGKRAGYRRNEVMAEHAQALIAIWDGVSKGTGHMIDIAHKKGLEVFVWRVDAA